MIHVKRVRWATILLLAALASPAAAQLPPIPTLVVNETPDTLDVWAVLPPQFGWLLVEALAPGDTAEVLVPVHAVGPDRMFMMGVRVPGTKRLHLTGRNIPGAPIFIRKEAPPRHPRLGTVGT